MQTLIAFILRNYTWLFSGAGMTVMILIARLLKRRRNATRSPEEPLETLDVHVEATSIPANVGEAQPAPAIGIHLSNASDQDLRITRASFAPGLAVFPKLRRPVPINASSFRDRRTGRYELKFGIRHSEFQTVIPRGDQVSTYLRLSRPISNDELEHRFRGKIIVEYATPNGLRTHVVSL